MYMQLDFYNASSQKQQSAERHVAPLRYIILFLSQPVFALDLSPDINVAYLTEKQQIPILSILQSDFGLTRSGIQPTIFHTPGKHANHQVLCIVCPLLLQLLITSLWYLQIVFPSYQKCKFCRMSLIFFKISTGTYVSLSHSSQ